MGTKHYTREALHKRVLTKVRYNKNYIQTKVVRK